jgi:hypothetical protein
MSKAAALVLAIERRRCGYGEVAMAADLNRGKGKVAMAAAE